MAGAGAHSFGGYGVILSLQVWDARDEAGPTTKLKISQSQRQPQLPEAKEDPREFKVVYEKH